MVDMVNSRFTALNATLDRWVRPTIRIGHHAQSAFHVCGYLGLALGILLTMSLVAAMGRPVWVMAAIIAASVLTFFGLALLTKLLTGEERLVFYHHAIAVLVVAVVLLRILRQPALPYLDATFLGLGLFLAFGRIGCLMAGCCHGRPGWWGVCYREEHAAAGFTPHYLGIRLIPIQALESLWVSATVATGSALVLAGSPPGAALAWCLVTYSAGRFAFEFWRGDPERPYWLGFSEAQWTSVGLVWCVAGAELLSPGLAEMRALRALHGAVAVGLVLAMLYVAWQRQRQGQGYRFLLPAHVEEFAAALGHVTSPAAPERLSVARTTLGIQISASQIWQAGKRIDHFALSSQSGLLTEKSAQALAGLVLRLRQSSTREVEFIRGDHGVYHLLIYSYARTEAGQPAAV